MAGTRLNQLVTVRGRFHRSVSLTRDWERGRDLSEYIATPAVQGIAEQILSELREPAGTRAWSITGPYGTGKSAFALFLADLLSSSKASHPVGQELQRAHLKRRQRMLPILLQAERGPLLPALADRLAEQLKPVASRLATKARRLAASPEATGDEISRLLLDAAEQARKKGIAGLVVIVDEFGKFLEYAASDPARVDVFSLQQIAEAAARSEIPILFITILHTGFADYLSHGDEVRRAEWQKVQGRFQDVPFQLPAEQLLGLVAHALETKFTNGVGEAYQKRLDRVLGSKELKEALARGSFSELVAGCLPLHPVTSLVLWSLFRSKIAQNERSLFAFLSSHEPHGFQDFLARSTASTKEAPLYGLPELYDYVASSLGLAAFTGSDSRKWALISHALDRIPASAPQVTRDIVKSIGLLLQYGVTEGVRPTQRLLRLILEGRPGFGEALDTLKQESIIFFRRHSNSYGIWEGSDLDLNALFDQARSRIAQEPIEERLRRAVDVRPVVARAHYIQSGTLRFFDVQISTPTARSIGRALKSGSHADGHLVFLVDNRPISAEQAKEFSEEISKKHIALVAVPRRHDQLTYALDELECWQWVQDHVTELEGDPVARQEVQARVDSARSAFGRVAGSVFGALGHSIDPTASDWFYPGRSNPPKSARGFQGMLSKILEKSYPKAPRLRNELLNRHNLSSAAAAARRNLLERMIEHGADEKLGITGYPPEFSMYQAMLVEGGFHLKRKDGFRFREPRREDWKPVWSEINEYLTAATNGRAPLAELIKILEKPPFGMRKGPIPVLIAAAFLVRGHEVALYEDGLFVPEMTIEVLERLLRRPETFELQSYQLNQNQQRVLEALRGFIDKKSGDESSQGDKLLSVVKGLVRMVAALPPYVKRTKRFPSPQTRAVRDLLLDATDPKALIFSELPVALGVELKKKDGPQAFARALQKSTIELVRSYPMLLETVEESVTTMFSLSGDVRAVLARRAKPLEKFAGDVQLQTFVREVARNDDREWRESLGRAVLNGKPTTHWHDEDAIMFPMRLQAMRTEFERLEELVAEAGEELTSTVVSIAVLEGGSAERRLVISCPDSFSDQVDSLVKEIRKSLGRSCGESDSRMQLVALATLANQIAQDQRVPEDVE